MNRFAKLAVLGFATDGHSRRTLVAICMQATITGVTARATTIMAMR